MSVSQSLRNQAYVLEKFVTLGVASGTTVGPAIPAGTVVLSAGFENLAAVPDITTYTVAIGDGTTTFMAATSFDAAAANTVKAGVTPGFIAAADTVDAVTVISGTTPAIAGRIWAVCVEVNDSVFKGASVDRNQLD